jgi:hypothetical protein
MPPENQTQCTRSLANISGCAEGFVYSCTNVLQQIQERNDDKNEAKPPNNTQGSGRCPDTMPGNMLLHLRGLIGASKQKYN